MGHGRIDLSSMRLPHWPVNHQLQACYVLPIRLVRGGASLLWNGNPRQAGHASENAGYVRLPSQANEEVGEEQPSKRRKSREQGAQGGGGRAPPGTGEDWLDQALNVDGQETDGEGVLRPEALEERRRLEVG